MYTIYCLDLVEGTHLPRGSGSATKAKCQGQKGNEVTTPPILDDDRRKYFESFVASSRSNSGWCIAVN